MIVFYTNTFLRVSGKRVGSFLSRSTCFTWIDVACMLFDIINRCPFVVFCVENDCAHGRQGNGKKSQLCPSVVDEYRNPKKKTCSRSILIMLVTMEMVLLIYIYTMLILFFDTSNGGLSLKRNFRCRHSKFRRT